jgi:hypothetical protein
MVGYFTDETWRWLARKKPGTVDGIYEVSAATEHHATIKRPQA